jgi:hypothetical protein
MATRSIITSIVVACVSEIQTDAAAAQCGESSNKARDQFICGSCDLSAIYVRSMKQGNLHAAKVAIIHVLLTHTTSSALN